MAQIVIALDNIGINAEGFRGDWETLCKANFPCIVHLSNPNHFIVVSGIEPTNGYVHVYNDSGNRSRLKRVDFEKRWTGYSLHLQKDQSKIAVNPKEKKPYIVFDYLIQDKGDIPAIGEPIEFFFPIHNFGQANLVIEDIKVNCGCLSSEKSESPIPPGKSGFVKLFYNVQPQRGVFTQTAVVKTNDPVHPVSVLSACGFTGVEVRVEPAQIVLDRLYPTYPSNIQCFIRYTGEWNEFHVELDSSNLTGVRLLKHDIFPLDEVDFSNTLLGLSPTTLSRSVINNNRILKLVFESDGTYGDTICGNIVLHTNIPGYERFTIPVSGRISSPIQAFPSIVVFDAENNSQEITLISKTKVPFRIVDTNADQLGISCKYELESSTELRIHIDMRGVFSTQPFVIQCRFENDAETMELPLTLFYREN